MYATLSGTRRFLLPVASVGALCALLTSGAFAQDESQPSGDPVVNVTEYDVVDLAVQDADLAQVLQMLSLQSHKNIITSKNVTATVTANLYDVTFHEALDAILHVNGFVWEEKGNFINIYTAEEWKERQEAEREMVTRIFELDYLSAEDALAVATQMLGENGSAAAQGAVEDGFDPEVSDGGADSHAYNVRLIVTAYPEAVDALAATLDDLDTPPDQVMVEAAIIQTKMDESNAFGVDFSIVGDMNFADIISPLNPVNALIGGGQGKNGFQPEDNKAQGFQSTPGNTSGPGTLKLGLVSDDISVFLKVLDSVTDSVVLARPKVTALNRQRAEVLVGARIGYLQTTATETTSTQSVDFLDTGVQLMFRPFISKDGSIRLELRPSVSEASLRQVSDANGAQVTIPDELTNELTTNVRVRDGQTLILGGLFREATSISRRQVPVLGEVPILGNAFRGQDDSVERSEIIFLITPTITHDQMITEDGQEALAMGELARIGARSGLLGFSREKMTVAHNQKAMEARAAGDIDLALYHVRNSLRLNPHQAEVIAMQQQLTGDIEQSYEKSLLERVMNRGMHHIGDPDNDENPEIISDASMETDPMATLDSIELVPTHDAEATENHAALEGSETGGAAATAVEPSTLPTEDATFESELSGAEVESSEAEPAFAEEDAFDWANEPATSPLDSEFSDEAANSQTFENGLESLENSDDVESDAFASESTFPANPAVSNWWFSRWFAFHWYGSKSATAAVEDSESN
jgi:type IV pilus assembly protein PilQ